jgi:hypothetical protein
MVNFTNFDNVALDNADRKTPELPYDVADDLHFHMKNDTMFYRRQFLPTIVKIAGDVNEEEGSESLIDPMLERAVKHYCEKYKIPAEQRRLIDSEVLRKVKERIMSEDVPSVQKGNQ